MLQKLSLLFIALTLSGCTLSINLANTRGTAEDIIDSTPTTSTEADAEVIIPASLI